MNGTTSPLVTAYLADLDRALAGADPADRLEIVDAVREHIETAVAELGATPTQAQVAGVLRRLGTADDVAAAWAVGEPPRVRVTSQAPGFVPASGTPLLRPSAHGVQPVPSDETRALTTSPWLRALVVIVGLALGLPLVLGLIGSAFLLATGSGNGWSYHHVTPGWVVVVVVVTAITAVLGLVAVRRPASHPRLWRTAFVVGLVLVGVLVVWGLHMGGYVGGRYDAGLPRSAPSPGAVVPAPSPTP